MFMNNTYTQTVLQANQYDPTRTTTIRNAFAREARRRFNELIRVIRQAVIEEDCFGIAAGFYQLTPPGRQAFAFPRSADKLRAFEEWLQLQIDRGLLELRTLEQVGVGVEGAWTNRYVFDSYKRGVIRARYELKKAGFDIPSIEQTGGIEISMSTPFHIDRLGLLYTRVFSELKNITAQMDQQISRVLAQGLADGDNPRLLARKLVSTINGTGMGELGITDTLGRFIPARRRAEIMARTEVIRAHHNATIQEYRNWAVEGIIVKAEMLTAGDARVCEECEAVAGGSPYTLDQAEKLIPVHPQCRCICLPYKEKR
jgi:SPP1 gp7 family putative phage head morphogenesis protein